jgi:hypothetical protein
MKLTKLAAIPAIAIAAGIGLAACGSAKAPAAALAAAPAVTHTVTAPAATPRTTPPEVAPTGGIAAPTTAAPAPAAPAPAPEPAYFTSATAVVTQFYQDITDQSYQAAWALGGDNLNNGSDYAGWVAGYDTTASISLGTFSAFGSDQVQVNLSALQTDGTTNTYQGTYTVAGGVIVAANIVQTG